MAKVSVWPGRVRLYLGQTDGTALRLSVDRKTPPLGTVLLGPPDSPRYLHNPCTIPTGSADACRKKRYGLRIAHRLISLLHFSSTPAALTSLYSLLRASSRH